VLSPPSEAGGVHDTVTWLLPSVTLTLVGTSGTVTAPRCLTPAMRTGARQVGGGYREGVGVPFVSPWTTHDVALAPDAVQVAPPGCAVTV